MHNLRKLVSAAPVTLAVVGVLSGFLVLLVTAQSSDAAAEIGVVPQSAAAQSSELSLRATAARFSGSETVVGIEILVTPGASLADGLDHVLVRSSSIELVGFAEGRSRGSSTSSATTLELVLPPVAPGDTPRAQVTIGEINLFGAVRDQRDARRVNGPWTLDLVLPQDDELSRALDVKVAKTSAPALSVGTDVAVTAVRSSTSTIIDAPWTEPHVVLGSPTLEISGVAYPARPEGSPMFEGWGFPASAPGAVLDMGPVVIRRDEGPEVSIMFGPQELKEAIPSPLATSQVFVDGEPSNLAMSAQLGVDDDGQFLTVRFRGVWNSQLSEPRVTTLSGETLSLHSVGISYGNPAGSDAAWTEVSVRIDDTPDGIVVKFPFETQIVFPEPIEL